MSPEPESPHTLKVLDTDSLARALEEMKQARITKARVATFLRLFMPMMGEKYVQFPHPYESLTEVLHKSVAGKYYGFVEPLLQIMAHLLYAEGNLEAAAAYWPVSYTDTIANTYANYYLSTSQIAGIAKMVGDSVKIPGGTVVPVCAEMLENLLETAPIMPSVMMLNPLLRGKLGFMPSLAGYVCPPQTTDVFPENSSLSVFNGEADFVGQFIGVCDYVENEIGDFQPSFTAVRLSDISRISTMFNLKEIWPKSAEKVLRSYRCRVVLLWAMLCKLGGMPSGRNVHHILRNLLGNIGGLQYFRLASTWLPELDKPSRAFFENINPDSCVRPVVRELCRYAKPDLSDGRCDVWINAAGLADNILDKYFKEGFLGLSFSGEFRSSSLYNQDYDRIQPFEIACKITTPLIYGMLATFAAVGLVEIACDSAYESPDNYFEGIKYVRLTALGRYVFGKDSQYNPVAEYQPEPPSIYLDENRLIVLATDDASNAIIKNTVGRKISANRYIVDDTTFMRKVAGKRDLKMKIDMLQRMARIDRLPANWCVFFDRILKRYDAITPLNINHLVMYAVDKDNAELLRIISENTEIRELITLVEGGRFLVRIGDAAKLRKLLLDYGYNLPEPDRYGYFSTR